MKDHKMNDTDTVAWHKQFWPWFLIILLGVSVLSSLLTVYYAVRDPDPVVDGNYYKQGLTINEKLGDKLPAVHKQNPPQEGESR